MGSDVNCDSCPLSRAVVSTTGGRDHCRCQLEWSADTEELTPWSGADRRTPRCRRVHTDSCSTTRRRRGHREDAPVVNHRFTPPSSLPVEPSPVDAARPQRRRDDTEPTTVLIPRSNAAAVSLLLPRCVLLLSMLLPYLCAFSFLLVGDPCVALYY